MGYGSVVLAVVGLLLVHLVNAQQCDSTSHVARFDCHPEELPTKEKCLARKCCWRVLVQGRSKASNESSDSDFTEVPFCYYPKDFPTYQVVDNHTTDFGVRLRLLKTQATYMPDDILDLTVDVIYEIQQRLRIRIYDSGAKRYEVPLAVPVVTSKANMSDYEVAIEEMPFAIVVKRKSTGATL
jgi:lysosomal alpha-glucosidase